MEKSTFSTVKQMNIQGWRLVTLSFKSKSNLTIFLREKELIY